jgi:hypothetical protein
MAKAHSDYELYDGLIMSSTMECDNFALTIEKSIKRIQLAV